jgi:hypothetical protein
MQIIVCYKDHHKEPDTFKEVINYAYPNDSFQFICVRHATHDIDTTTFIDKADISKLDIS